MNAPEPLGRVVSVDSRTPDPELIEKAATIISSGGLVAFPTETVYGLGADATNPQAVERIFLAKGRPAYNPLIVHVSDRDHARSCIRDWTSDAELLATAFWPGPLTLVLPRSTIIPDVVTAGRDTVGVRMPAGAVARRLIERSKKPIAAPSANKSNHVSPTLAQHVVDDLGDAVDLILDAGPTELGLESTVVDLSADAPRILRPGPITVEEIERVLGRHVQTGKRGGLDELRPLSPGQLPRHYAPRTPAVRLSRGQLEATVFMSRCGVLVLGSGPLETEKPPTVRVNLEEPSLAASLFYRTLREFDALGLDVILVVEPPDKPEWRAIRDRLKRAMISY